MRILPCPACGETLRPPRGMRMVRCPFCDATLPELPEEPPAWGQKFLIGLFVVLCVVVVGGSLLWDVNGLLGILGKLAGIATGLAIVGGLVALWRKWQRA